MKIKRKHPDWMKVPVTLNENYRDVKRALNEHNLNTVCQSAKCPNIGHCFASGTATFLILGNYCTRNCSFCNIASRKPGPPDPAEPGYVAEAVKKLKLEYTVITSVTRDDLPDGGAEHFAETIRVVRSLSPGTRVEVLTPDFLGDRNAIETVVKALPDVLNHNIETVPRLYETVRPKADYSRSLTFLQTARDINPNLTTKSGLMVGLGENIDEIESVLKDLRNVDVNVVTIGQYLQPSKDHHPIIRYYTPKEFDKLKKTGMEMGFSHVESGPLVRSSYHAKEQTEKNK